MLRLSGLVQSLGYTLYVTTCIDLDMVCHVMVLYRMINSVNEVAIQYLSIPA